MPRIFLAASLGVHALFGMWVKVRDLPATETRVMADAWTGHGIELEEAVGENRPDTDSATAARAPVRESAESGVSNARERPPGAEPELPFTATAHVAAAARRVRSTPRRADPAPASRATERSKPAASATTAPTESAAGAASGSPAGGAFGAAGLPAGVRHLPKAFTRALGLASRGDPRWLTQGVGTVGEARFHLGVDDDGRLGAIEYDEPHDATRLPPALTHLLENTRLLLAAGRFSLDASRARGGTQALRVRVEISDAAASDPDADPTGLHELEYEAPSGRKPGRGSFRLNSGRRVIGWVYVE